jgi:hypothetical protein
MSAPAAPPATPISDSTLLDAPAAASSSPSYAAAPLASSPRQ